MVNKVSSWTFRWTGDYLWYFCLGAKYIIQLVKSSFWNHSATVKQILTNLSQYTYAYYNYMCRIFLQIHLMSDLCIFCDNYSPFLVSFEFFFKLRNYQFSHKKILLAFFNGKIELFRNKIIARTKRTLPKTKRTDIKRN